MSATRLATSASQPVRSRGRLLAAAALVALALAGCTPNGTTVETGPVIDRFTGSEANITSLSEVIRLSPSDPLAYNMRGAAYAKAGNLSAALADFNMAIQLNPGYAQAYANRALVHRTARRYGEALRDYGRAIEINPAYDLAYVGRGNVHRDMNNVPAALDDFAAAIRLAPGDPTAYHNRGVIYQRQGNHAFAIQDFTGAIERNASEPAPFVGRATSYLATNYPKGALEDLDLALNYDNRNADAWFKRGIACEQLHQIDEAKRSYQASLRIEPQNQAAREALVRLGVQPNL